MSLKGENLAISVALINAVREHCMFSPNINKFNKTEAISNLYKYNQWIIDRARRKEYEYIIFTALRYKVGRCGELTGACKLLTSKTAIPNSQNRQFLSCLLFNHQFGIICSQKKPIPKRWDSFEKLLSTFPDRDAVICDPWIWKASDLDSYHEHVSQAELYGVENYYTREVNLYSKTPFTQFDHYTLSEEFEKLKKTFWKFYKSEIRRLNNRSFICSSHGREFSSFNESLLLNHITPQQEEWAQLQQRKLADFINRIKASSSAWYSFYKSTDRKGQALQKLLDYCSKKVSEKDYMGEDKIISVLKAAISVALIPRGDTTNSQEIRLKTEPKKTKTAQAALTALQSHEYFLLKDVIARVWGKNEILDYCWLLKFAGINNFQDLYSQNMQDYYYHKAEEFSKNGIN